MRKDCKLKDICICKASNISLKDIMDRSGDFPLYGASGFVKTIDSYHMDIPYIGIIKDGSGVGRVNMYPAYSSILGTMQYIIPKDNCVINYLFFLLNSLNLSDFARGAAIPHIYFTDYGNIRIKLHSLEQQQQIVEELDSLTSIIEKQKKQLEELDNLAQAIFYDMFGSIHNNKKSLDINNLNDLCEFIKDGTHNTPQYTDDKVNGVKFLSAKDVVEGCINWENIKYIPYELHAELHKRIAPQRDDILLCKNGTTGIAAIVDTDDVFDIYVSLALLRFKEPYNAIYVLYAINNPYTKEQFNSSLKGVGVPNLHLGEIKKARILWPPFSLQQEFASKIEAIEKQKELIKKSIKETEELFNSRMDYYFN